MLLVFCFGNNICKSQVMMTLVHLIELVQATSMVPIEPDLVDKAVADFFASVKASDWEDLAHSKFHWLCHFACHQKKLTFLPSCWCHERKHKQAKKFCSQTYNTHGYEFGILKELCSQDLHNLQKEDVFATHARLQQRGAASKQVRKLLQDHLPFTELYTCSVACLEPAGTTKKGDVVLYGAMNAGQVCQHFEVDNEALTLLKNFVMVAYDSGTCSGIWKTTDDHVFICTSSIKCSLVYSNQSNDRIVGLGPLAFRPTT